MLPTSENNADPKHIFTKTFPSGNSYEARVWAGTQRAGPNVIAMGGMVPIGIQVVVLSIFKNNVLIARQAYPDYSYFRMPGGNLIPGHEHALAQAPAELNRLAADLESGAPIRDDSAALI
jgi:hypothetical protein